VGDLALYRRWLPDVHMPFGDGLALCTALAPFNLETLFYIILPYAVILAAIGLLNHC